MRFRSLVALTLLLSLVPAVGWMLIPPFPAPEQIIDMQPSSLAASFGPPLRDAFEAPIPFAPARLLTWTKSRGILRWILEVTWYKPPTTANQPPDGVSRAVRIPWINITVPCGLVARAQIVTPPRTPATQAPHVSYGPFLVRIGGRGDSSAAG